MTFKYIANSTTADYQDCNLNFLHIGQGNIWPRGGTLMEPTTDVYDLGSSAYRHDKVVVNNVYCDSITTGNMVWHKIADVTLTTTASSIEIIGLANTTNLNIIINYKTDSSYAGGVFINNSTMIPTMASHKMYTIIHNVSITSVAGTQSSSYTDTNFDILWREDGIMTIDINNNNNGIKLLKSKHIGAMLSSMAVYYTLNNGTYEDTNAIDKLLFVVLGGGKLQTNTNIRIYTTQ